MQARQQEWKPKAKAGGQKTLNQKREGGVYVRLSLAPTGALYVTMQSKKRVPMVRYAI